MTNVGVLELIILALICLPVLAVVAIYLIVRYIRAQDQERQVNMKKCPYCAEFIKQEALVCRYCGRDQPQET